MGNTISLGDIALETLFGVVTIFLFFAPVTLNWSKSSYIGGLSFLILTFSVLIIKYRK